MSVIAYVRYNRVKGYSRKCTIALVANTRSKRRNKREYIKVFVLGFLLNLLSDSTSLKIRNCTQPDGRYIKVCYILDYLNEFF
jgi:hypothetical protein